MKVSQSSISDFPKHLLIYQFQQYFGSLKLHHSDLDISIQQHWKKNDSFSILVVILQAFTFMTMEFCQVRFQPNDHILLNYEVAANCANWVRFDVTDKD